MTSRRFLSLILLLLLGFNGQAQNENDETIVGFFIEAGMSSSHYKLKTFETFRNNYNLVNAARLNGELGSLSPGMGTLIGFGGFIGVPDGGMFEVNIVKMLAQEQTVMATMKNGDRREFKLKYAPIESNFDILFAIKRYLLLGPTIGLQIQHATLYSGYRYQNGPLSYGEDQSLNGIFAFREKIGIPLGLRLDARILKVIRLSFKANYTGYSMGLFDESKRSLIPHRDEMMAKITGGSVYRDGYTQYALPIENPLDGQGSKKLLNNGDTEGFALARPFRGFQYSLSLKLQLKSWILKG